MFMKLREKNQMLMVKFRERKWSKKGEHMFKKLTIALLGGATLLLASCGSTEDLPIRTGPQAEHPVTVG